MNVKLENIIKIIVVFAFGVTGFIGFLPNEEEVCLKKYIDIFFQIIKILSFNFPAIEEMNVFNIIASFLGIFITIYTIVALLARQIIINIKIFFTKNFTKHIGVFGLGENNKLFIENLEKKKNLILIEQNKIYSDEYIQKGYNVININAFDDYFLEKKLNFDKMEYAIISFGDDKINIEFTKRIIEIYKKRNIKSALKIIVHIYDKNLSNLFYKNFIFSNSNIKVNIKTYSYYEECARDLFDKHSLDGDTTKYINSNDELNTVLIGDNDLLKRIVYKIISISHFPNQNIHKLTIINKNSIELLEKVKTYINYGCDYNGRKKFPTIELNAIDLDYEKQDFYFHKIWNNENLENIILCFDDENINLTVGTSLHDKVFLNKKSNHIPKILMGIFKELSTSKSINHDKKEYSNMFTYGNQNDILNSDNLLNETTDRIAKLIHKGYSEVFNLEELLKDSKEEELDEQWFKSTKYSDKISNISQARHIDIKLKSLGLSRIKIKDGDKKNLLKYNRKILDNALQNIMDINYSELIEASKELKKDRDNKEFEVKYWPTDFNKNIFTKLINIEHNRWMSSHYLEGWSYSKKKNKSIKEHDCLISLEDFHDDSKKLTIIYDIYSFLYIPNYLADVNYKLIPYINKIGVTGHRNNICKNIKLLNKTLFNILSNEGITHIVSPLAEGADRIVAKYAIENFKAKLIAPIPFKIEEYKKDFNDKSKKEFDEILGQVKPIELSSFENKDKYEPIYDDKRNNLYRKCGEYVVDNCDILIAIWDGQEAKGIGGTAQIVEYAKDKNKKIIHINSTTLEVKYYN